MAQNAVIVGPASSATRGLRAAKLLADGLAFLCVVPLLAVYRAVAGLLPARRDAAFQGCSQALSLAPGTIGDYLRRAFYRAALTGCSARCTIGFGTIFAAPEVEIADGVYIGAFCNIGHVSIGADTLIGSSVTILSGKHQHHHGRLDIPMRLQGGVYERVRIGADVWIGNGAIVMVDVADQAVVAAGAVVVKPVDARTIVAGNPARVIGQRGSDPGSCHAEPPV